MDTDFIATPRKQTKIKTMKEVNVNMAKETRDIAIKKHKQEIKKLKNDIKKYKLLIKQARLAYKISSM